MPNKPTTTTTPDQTELPQVTNGEHNPAILETIIWKDYQGKPLYYLRIKTAHGELTINVGSKTIEKVNQLIKQ